MTTLSKQDVAAVRKADAICIHLNKENPAGLVRLIRRGKPTDDRTGWTGSYVQDAEYRLPADVRVGGYQSGYQEQIEAGTASCFAHVSIYHFARNHVFYALRSLRAEDEIAFEFCPDYHTNGYIALAGLHADVCYLKVRRNGKTVAEWALETTICPNNTARMCRGFPDTENYRNMANEARKIA